MTGRQFNQRRKWELRTKTAYEAGVLDGMDMAFIGEPRPQEIFSEFDTTFYVRRYMRHAQGVSNAAIARHRGKLDGFDHAMAEMKKADDEEYVQTQVELGMQQIETYLRQAA